MDDCLHIDTERILVSPWEAVDDRRISLENHANRYSPLLGFYQRIYPNIDNSVSLVEVCSSYLGNWLDDCR